MLNFIGSHSERLAVIAAMLLMTVPALAQQAEVPPIQLDEADAVNVAEESQEPDRIVDGKPNLYSFGRSLHPVSWLEAGFRPLLRAMDKAAFENFGSDKPSHRESGVKFGVQSLGSSSGFGAQVKPFHKNLFDRGI